MEIIFSDDFKKEFKKIKDSTLRIKIIKQIKRLQLQPTTGKPLQYELKNYRSLRVPPFRIIYRLKKDTIIINCFEHRKKVYS